MSMVMHTFNYSTYETGKQLSMRSAWSTYWIPGQPLVHSDTLSQIKTWKKKKNYWLTKQGRKPGFKFSKQFLLGNSQYQVFKSKLISKIKKKKNNKTIICIL